MTMDIGFGLWVSGSSSFLWQVFAGGLRRPHCGCCLPAPLCGESWKATLPVCCRLGSSPLQSRQVFRHWGWFATATCVGRFVFLNVWLQCRPQRSSFLSFMAVSLELRVECHRDNVAKCVSSLGRGGGQILHFWNMHTQ